VFTIVRRGPPFASPNGPARAERHLMSILLLPFVASARDALVAHDLLMQFGEGAAGQAAVLANDARRVGNHIAFCRWRQVERLVRWLEVEAAPGTVH
jgi:hypothetical protein